MLVGWLLSVPSYCIARSFCKLFHCCWKLGLVKVLKCWVTFFSQSWEKVSIRKRNRLRSLVQMRQTHLCQQKLLRHYLLLRIMMLSSVLTASRQLIATETPKICLSVKIAMQIVSTFNMVWLFTNTLPVFFYFAAVLYGMKSCCVAPQLSCQCVFSFG